MANVFQVQRVWRTAGSVGKSLQIVTGLLVIDTTAQGGADPADLPASMFGMSRILTTTPAVNSANSAIIVTAPSHTGASLIVRNVDDNALADLPNGTYALTLTGY